MNTENGRIYRGDDAIRAAQERGEPVVDVSEAVARKMEQAQENLDASLGRGNRRQRRFSREEDLPRLRHPRMRVKR